LAAPIARHGSFNFLLSNGDALWAHASTRLHWLLRQHPFQAARLQDRDLTVNFAEHTTPEDRVIVVVTEPLTADEAWQAFLPGELKVFQDGRLLDA
ncbi:class II glutamine amidotransferase, partial [Salmonella enterica]|uniref:class II glutamine amidotransferase n=1 Tax=Salmonella enterica TaxID=28901 RepID=UPI003FA71478